MVKQYKLKRGMLIAIEGIDGAGKTTLVNKLVFHYREQGYSCVKFKEPTDGKYGQQIKQLADQGRDSVSPEEEMYLFLKDREENRIKNIEPALSNNKLVILDRYYFSSVAYQGSRGLDPNYIRKKNEEIAIKPDLVIVLDCAARVGLSRIRNLRNETPNHFEKEDLLEKARRIFKSQKEAYIQEIDASEDIDSVFLHARSIVEVIIKPLSKELTNQPDLFGSYDENIKFNVN